MALPFGYGIPENLKNHMDKTERNIQKTLRC